MERVNWRGGNKFLEVQLKFKVKKNVNITSDRNKKLATKSTLIF